MQLLDDGAWGAGGDEDAVPAEDVEAGEAGFGDGGEVGGEGGALDGGDGEAAEAAGLDVRQACGADGEHDLDLAGEEVGDRGGNRLVGGVQHVHAGHLLEELGGEVRRGAAAAGAVVWAPSFPRCLVSSKAAPKLAKKGGRRIRSS